MRQALQDVVGALPIANIIGPREAEATNSGDSIKAAGRAKAIMAEAEAQARANQLLAQSLTPALVPSQMVSKWNGQMPQVSGGATPMIQRPAPRP